MNDMESQSTEMDTGDEMVERIAVVGCPFALFQLVADLACRLDLDLPD